MGSREYGVKTPNFPLSKPETGDFVGASHEILLNLLSLALSLRLASRSLRAETLVSDLLAGWRGLRFSSPPSVLQRTYYAFAQES
jgi:hypothetical protein